MVGKIIIVREREIRTGKFILDIHHVIIEVKTEYYDSVMIYVTCPK